MKKKYKIKQQISVAKNIKYIKESDWFLCVNVNKLKKALTFKPKGIILTKEMYEEFRYEIKCSYMICENPQ